jgi:hypothetical protein
MKKYLDTQYTRYFDVRIKRFTSSVEKLILSSSITYTLLVCHLQKRHFCSPWLFFSFCSWDSERNVSVVMGCNKPIYPSTRRSVILSMCIYSLFNGIFKSSSYMHQMLKWFMNDELHMFTTVAFWVLINRSFVGAYRRCLHYHDKRIRAFDVCVTVHHWYNNIKSQLDATIIILLIISISSSGDDFVHPQEH